MACPLSRASGLRVPTASAQPRKWIRYEHLQGCSSSSGVEMTPSTPRVVSSRANGTDGAVPQLFPNLLRILSQNLSRYMRVLSVARLEVFCGVGSGGGAFPSRD